MQYVRSIQGSVSKTWNSINPANLSGAIDVIVVEQEDGSLACSPFHVRFGKFSLLRPSEKKVEFKVNGIKQEYAMKLGDGGEAFFVFETLDEIPVSLQTSPIVSPAGSPPSLAAPDPLSPSSLQEPTFLDISSGEVTQQSSLLQANPGLSGLRRAQSSYANLTTLSRTEDGRSDSVEGVPAPQEQPMPPQWKRSNSAFLLPTLGQSLDESETERKANHYTQSQPSRSPSTSDMAFQAASERSNSPSPSSRREAYDRALSLSKKLADSKIPTLINDTGDLMLDMAGYKTNEEDALRAEVVARKVLAEELEGNYNIGALIGADDRGNLWIYGSKESKEAAQQKFQPHSVAPGLLVDRGLSPDNRSDDGTSDVSTSEGLQKRSEHDARPTGLVTPPQTPPTEQPSGGDPNRNYAKTLRLTSDQLKALELKPGSNSMSFSVNRATCQAFMHYWTHDVPVVISDIDGTITKSDALGHVLNMIGRDWTHVGVAKLYTDIVANGYNILYLTSRSVGQADTTRAYLDGVSQEGFRLPKGPVIMSPDRTMAALKREVYLRKPEVFKMACLRDILGLFGQRNNPFYAGFGNRFTDALSYRSVGIPSTRIFTINSSAEVSLDLLTLNTYRTGYVTMREVVDHFFPPLALLVSGENEAYTDFNYWRDAPEDIDVLTDSDDEDVDKDDAVEGRPSIDSAYLDDDDEAMVRMGESYLSQQSVEEEERDGSLSLTVEQNLDIGDEEIDLVP